jgi:nucleoid-associated protein YgaU
MEKKPILILAALVVAGLGALTYAQRGKPGTPIAVTPEASKPAVVAAKPEEPAKPAAEAAKPAAEAPKPADPQKPAEQPAVAEKPVEAPAAEQKIAVAEPPKTVDEPKAETPPAAAVPLPSFDTVRVEEGGNTIVAGRAEPNAEITIKHNGVIVGSGTANADGAFVVTPDKPLPNGPGVISIEMKSKDKVVASQQTVAVDVRAKTGSEPMVAVLTPGAPTKLVQAPGEKAAMSAPMKTVMIDSTDYDEKGNMIFGGRGPAGSKVQLYVDNKPYDAMAEIGKDGSWTLAGKAPLDVGAHTMRADEIGQDGGVKSRVEMPFFREDPQKIIAMNTPKPEPEKTATTTTTVIAKDAETGVEVKAQAQVQTPITEPPAQTAAAVPEKPVEPAAPAAEPPKTEEPAKPAEAVKPAEAPAQTATAESAKPAEQPPAAEAAKPVEPQQQSSTVAAAGPEPTAAPVPDPTITIQPGNNLWRLSRGIYGKGVMYTVIYEANKANIRNPNLIYPGQVFVTPRGEAKAAN